MVILAVLALVLGVLVGTFDVQNFLLDALVSNKDLVLYLLMFSVGMSIGLHKGIIKKIKEYHVKILIIPAGIIVGTLLGGVLLSMVTKYNGKLVEKKPSKALILGENITRKHARSLKTKRTRVS